MVVMEDITEDITEEERSAELYVSVHGGLDHTFLKRGGEGELSPYQTKSAKSYLMLPNAFGLCALPLDIYVRIALSRFEQSCVKSESHLYILCNYLPFSKAAKGAQGGPQQHETPEQKHSPTDISKRLRSSQNNMDCIYMTPIHCLLFACMNQGLAALPSMPPVFSFEFLGDTNTYGNCNGWMGQQFRTFS